MASVGQDVRRLEDARLVTGRGRFTDDIHLPGLLEAHVVRSPHAHARIARIDVAAARALPGIVAVWTHDDLERLERRLPMILPDRRIVHPKTPDVLAGDVVRYVGEPVAFVVAESRYLAEDAGELVEVDYEPLPAVSALADAVASGAPLVHPEAEGNIAASDAQKFGDVEAVIAAAAVVVRERFELSRGSAQSLEPRAVVAHYDGASERLTVWDTTQAPIPVRNTLAGLLKLPLERVRVIAGDVGGGFGPKMVFYAEEVLVPYAALRLERPVKWVEDRLESFVATTSEREQIHDVVAAADGEGRLLAFRDHFYYETGAYIPYGLNIPFVTSIHLLGLYRIPNFQVSFDAVFTNRMFVSPYRGAGRPYAVFTIEQVMNRIAEKLGMDPAEVRRRNLISPDEMPHRYPLTYWDGGPVEYDTGDYPALLEKALAAVGYEDIRARQSEWRATGRHVGVGIAVYSEVTGIGPYEGARVRVDPDGRIVVATGIGSQGQGHQTTLAQVVADRLGVRPEEIDVTVGDSDAFGWGIGTFASRGAVTVGNAATLAAEQVAARAKAWASEILEAAVEDLELADGAVRVKGSPDLGVSLADLASKANPSRWRIAVDPATFRPGLEAEGYFNPQQGTMAAGVHACVVEVDIETGVLRILKYVVVHDCGSVIHPGIVEGQIVGGVAQGVGGAFYERLVYDTAGQILTTSYMDYLLPTAAEVPPVVTYHRESPSPHNQLGVKGVGEAGVLPGHAVVAGAIEDALRGFGVRVAAMPLGGPSALKALIRAARARSGEKASSD